MNPLEEGCEEFSDCLDCQLCEEWDTCEKCGGQIVPVRYPYDPDGSEPVVNKMEKGKCEKCGKVYY